MLVLTRKMNETIVIDGRITLEILQIQGDRIRVGIQAPAEIKILRGELMPFAADVNLPPLAERVRMRNRATECAVPAADSVQEVQASYLAPGVGSYIDLEISAA
ncbi:MAG TPA: carbon storage regulator [Pirellulaceae bacterium]|nr:carbon storage regulator [Pirellulaceae bacterium]